MPELPEVQTIAAQLDKELSGLKLASFLCFSEKVCQPSPRRIKQELEGKRLHTVSRMGKMVVFDFGRYSLLIHLKLTGRLLLAHCETSKLRWERVRADFEADHSLRFDDMRLFGFVKLVTTEKLTDLRNELGPDALRITPHIFYDRLRGRRIAIKKALMDQKIISGVGNIYANEALFKARIHPERQAKSLTFQDSERLLRSLKEVLKKGIVSKGATLADEMYRDIYNRKGQYGQYVLVYDRLGQDCPNHCGGKVQKIKLGGRGTYFCPRCQH